MSVERFAALLTGFALLMAVPWAWPIVVPAAVFASYGLLPRRGVRVGSGTARVACKVVGISLLAFSLPPVLCATFDNPLVLPALLVTLAIPALALTLYGFEVGVVPILSVRTAAYVRALTATLVISALGLVVVTSYVEMAASNPEFLTEPQEVAVPGLPPAKVVVPGWVLFCLAFGFGLFLSIPSFAALIRLKHIVSNLEGAPRIGWYSDKGCKAAQLLLLVMSALMVGVGPAIYSESGVLLAALGVPALGALLILTAADPMALKATYKEVMKSLKPAG